jgi:lipoate-protein ligase A
MHSRDLVQYLELTLPTPEQNIACDEALLLGCEEREEAEVLRLWESPQHFAVLGYSGKIAAEISLSACRRQRVSVLRRVSGGGTVLQGPGCFNYALVLKIAERAGLHDVRSTNAFVMERLRLALAPLVKSPITVRGFTDLTLGAQKFSGNAQYRKRRALLFHGSFLLDFDISLIEKLLPRPSKQPAYRRNRSHEEFLINLNLSSVAIKAALRKSWGANEELKDIPFDAIDALVGNRYSKDEWNYRF